jgi:hypothetical protein
MVGAKLKVQNTPEFSFVKDTFFSDFRNPGAVINKRLVLIGKAGIFPSTDAQRQHKGSARSFCFTMPRQTKIFTAPEIENIPDRYMAGILLHELGHIFLQRFSMRNREQDEVAVDQFCLYFNVGYAYENFRLKDGRCAYNLQRVTGDGLNVIRKYFRVTVGGSNGRV